jgi:SAM-dependent methyltransferase
MRTVYKIPFNEITFEPASMIDGAGRVFRWNSHLYRAIRYEYAAFYLELFDKKNIQTLFSKGLVTTNIAPLSLDGYAFVLEHDYVPFTSYCAEWSSEMLKAAALLVCDLSIELYAKGLTFKDAHPWNILFDGGRPIFVDWGSIGPTQEQPRWPYQEFRERFLYPLYLMCFGQYRFARMFMLDVVNRPKQGDVFRLLLRKIPFRTWIQYLLNDRRCMQACFRINVDFFQSLRRMLESIPMTVEKTEWSEYDGPYGKYSYEPSKDWSARMLNVYRVLKTLRPKTVLDIGCNKGWFSELAALEGAQVIAIDIDEPSINSLYHRVRLKRLPILPLVMDICAQTPPHGVNHSYPQAETRLQSEMVLALALTHHLVFKRGLTFESIAKQLAAFTKKWLIVEFIPAEDEHVTKWMNERFSWYHLEGFARALRVFFKRIEVLDSSPLPRLLLLCER